MYSTGVEYMGEQLKYEKRTCVIVQGDLYMCFELKV